MTSTTPEAAASMSNVGNGDNMAWDVEGAVEGLGAPEAESEQAKKARSEALSHARAARAARARYARLVAAQPGMSSRYSNYDNMQEQNSRISRAETAVVLSGVANQIRDTVVDGFLDKESPNPVAKALASGVAAWAPIAVVKPATNRGGIGGFVSDPRVWSAGLIGLTAVGNWYTQNSVQQARIKKDAKQKKKAKRREKARRQRNAVKRQRARLENQVPPRQTSLSTE